MRTAAQVEEQKAKAKIGEEESLKVPPGHIAGGVLTLDKFGRIVVSPIFGYVFGREVKTEVPVTLTDENFVAKNKISGQYLYVYVDNKAAYFVDKFEPTTVNGQFGFMHPFKAALYLGKARCETKDDKVIITEVSNDYPSGASYDTISGVDIPLLLDDISDPTGFASPENLVISWDSSTRKVTLTGFVRAYWRGRVIQELVSGWVSEAHGSTTNTMYFLCYDGNKFQWLTSFSDFSLLQIARVWYGSSTKFADRECHSFMPWQTHRNLHKTIGTFRQSGGTLSGYTLSSTTASNRRPDVSSSVIIDEDCPTTLAAITDEKYAQEYLSGSGASSVFVSGASDIVPLSGSQPYWNEYTGGAWQQSLMANNSYMSVWLIATPKTSDATSQSYRFLWVQGQSNGSLLSEQAKTFSDINRGDFSLSTQEYVPIARIIIQYTASNWTLTQVETITGSLAQLSYSPAGFLAAVSTDTSLEGDGTVGNPLKINDDAWIETTPTWTNLSAGNASVNVCRHKQVGKTVFMTARLTFGSTTSVSGVVKLTPPVAPKYSGTATVGTATLVDASAGRPYSGSYLSNGDVGLSWANDTYSYIGGVDATSPFSWTNGDSMFISATYEAA